MPNLSAKDNNGRISIFKFRLYKEDEMLTYRDLCLWPELHAQYHAGESYIKLSNTDLDTKYYFVCTGDLEFHTKRS